MSVPVLSLSTSGSPEETNMSVNYSRPGLLPADTVTYDLANIVFPSLPLHQYRIIIINDSVTEYLAAQVLSLPF